MNMVKFRIYKEHFDAVVFDMEGVVTRTAKSHAKV